MSPVSTWMADHALGISGVDKTEPFLMTGSLNLVWLAPPPVTGVSGTVGNL